MFEDENLPVEVGVECKNCGDTHLMRERKEHEFRLDVTVCPVSGCDSTRKLVVSD